MVRSEVINWLKILMLDEQTVLEIRALGAETPSFRRQHVESGYWDSGSIEKFPDALSYMKYAGVYATLNPVNPDLLARCGNRLQPAKRDLSTTDADIVRRCWLPIDCDPVRPAGISATEAEHDAAQAKAKAVRDALHSRGWPDPVILDSGNGAALLYRVELPTDDGGIVSRCLAALGAEFSDDQVKIDPAVANAARIWRVAGTWNCKGDDTPDRPHRLAAIRYAPDPLKIVPQALLDALAGPAPAVAPRAEARPTELPRTDRPGDQYNENRDLGPLLTANGWTLVDQDDRNQYWRRPGKDSGNHSATYDGTTFYVFSSAASPFEANTGYRPFAVYTLLEHGGDFTAASQALSDQGFGDRAGTRADDSDIDLSLLLAKLKVRPVETDPPPAVPQKTLPENLLFAVPGFISQVMAHTLETAPYPNPVLAFCGALALQSALAGRKVCDSLNNHPAMYLIALADSGVGKEHPRIVNINLLMEGGAKVGLADAFASGEGLEDALFLQPSMLAQTDEIDALFESIKRGREPRTEVLMQALLKAYSASASHYPMRKKVGQDQGVISYPSLTLLGTAIPEHFYRAMSVRMLSNGLFARMLVFEAGPRQRGKMRDLTRPTPQTILDTVRLWTARGEEGGNLMGAVAADPVVVPDAPGAADASCEVQDMADALYPVGTQEGEGATSARALWSRAFQKTRKLALVYACSENPTDPVITAEGVRWAWEIVRYSTDRQLHMAGLHVADGEFDAQCKKVLGILEGRGGGATRSEVMRGMRCPSKVLNEVITALLEQEVIASEVEQTAGRPKNIYRLLRAGE